MKYAVRRYDDVRIIYRPQTADEDALDSIFGLECYAPVAQLRPKQGDRWLDAGAHVGIFAVWAMRQAQEVSVDCYEPMPKNYAHLLVNIRSNDLDDLVHPHRVALGTRTGCADFYISARADYKTDSHSLLPKQDVTPIEVEVRAIQDVLNMTRYDGIKLDIEGAELAILDALDDWSTVRKLVLEYHFYHDPDLNNYQRRIDRLRSCFDTVVEVWNKDYRPPAVAIIGAYRA